MNFRLMRFRGWGRALVGVALSCCAQALAQPAAARPQSPPTPNAQTSTRATVAPRLPHLERVGVRPLAPTIAPTTLPADAKGPGPSVRLNAFDTRKYMDEDRALEGVPGVPTRVGVNRPLPGGLASIGNAGRWVAADGKQIWFFQLEVPGAMAVRVHFSRCDLPASGRLLVYGAGKADPDVYVRRGPTDNGEFWAAAVPGETVHVEYQAPQGEKQRPVLDIDQISHIYGGFPSGAPGQTGLQDAGQDGGVIPMALLNCERDVQCYAYAYDCTNGTCPAGSPRAGLACTQDSDCNAYPCTNNVCPAGSPHHLQACTQDSDCNYYACTENACPTGSPRAGLACTQDSDCNVDQIARDSVGLMLWTVGTHTYLCSGSLLADNDPNTYAGYFLTANHCLSDQASVNSLTVYWLYQTSQCNGTFPSLTDVPKSIGGTLLATSPTSDFTFIRLADDPHDGQGFAGSTEVAPLQTDILTGIHHPQGGYKRISFGTLAVNPTICDGHSTADYWYLHWNTGIIEPGSSGSPLFNNNWEVVGQLFGWSCAEPNCSNLQQSNILYGRFNVTDQSISTWLNPVPPTSDDAYEPNDTLVQAAPITRGSHTLRLVDFEDYFLVSSPRTGQITVAASYNPNDFQPLLQLLYPNNTLIAQSETWSGTETVSANLPAGNYIIRMFKEHKWGGDYTLNITMPPPSYSDFDHDGDVDMDDFGHLQQCYSGPAPQTDPACGDALLNDDDRVDASDMAIFDACYSGPNVPAAAGCTP